VFIFFKSKNLFRLQIFEFCELSLKIGFSEIYNMMKGNKFYIILYRLSMFKFLSNFRL
jgi:hypothetical protein